MNARKICDIYLDNQQTLLRLMQIVILKDIALIYCIDRVKPYRINTTKAIGMLEIFSQDTERCVLFQDEWSLAKLTSILELASELVERPMGMNAKRETLKNNTVWDISYLFFNGAQWETLSRSVSCEIVLLLANRSNRTIQNAC